MIFLKKIKQTQYSISNTDRFLMNMVRKIEALINRYLIRLGNFLLGLIPLKIKNKYRIFIDFNRNFFVKRKTKLAEYFRRYKAKCVEKISKLRTFPYAEFFKKIISERIKKIKSIRIKQVKEYLCNLMQRLRESAIYFWRWIRSGDMLKLGTVGLFELILLVGIVAVVVRVVRSQKKNEVVVEKKLTSTRPEYYKGHLRQITLDYIHLPIYIEGDNPLKALVCNLIIEVNRRSVIKYIKNNDLLVRDYIFSRIQPIYPKFILTNEAKLIIREKLVNELNKLLVDQHVDGRIENVYFSMLKTD